MNNTLDRPDRNYRSYPAPEANKPLKRRDDRMASLLTENFWLKMALPVVAIAFGANAYYTHQASESIKHFRPIVIQSEATGRMQAVEYIGMNNIPTHANIQYFLGDFINKFYRRSKATVAEQWPEAFFFLEANLGNGIRTDAQTTGFPDKFIAGRDPQPECDITINNVVFSEMPASPLDVRKKYEGRIDFTKNFYNQAHQSTTTEKWTTQVWFTFTPKIENDLILKNPIGLVVTSFDTHQAFTTN